MMILRCSLSIECLSTEWAGSAENLCAGQTESVVRLPQEEPVPSLTFTGSSTEKNCHDKNSSLHPLMGKEGKSTRKQHEKPSCRIQFEWVGPRLHQTARGKNY